ncbi:MAG TPA: penicillin-binding protein 2, partial [Candidatus Tenderia sp.]|nr:penicillin-binding protein 2 [Candidatus Tenderia sp.]
MAHIALRDNLRESQLFSNRAVVAVVFIILALLALVGRMVYLQIMSHDHYTTLSHNNRVSIVPLAPTRGLIFDRNGVIVAQNLPTFSLEIVPERCKNLDQT